MYAVNSLKREDNDPEEGSNFKRPKGELIPIRDILDQVMTDLSAEAVKDCDNKPLTNAPTRESRAVEEENIGVIQFRIVFNDPEVTLAQEDVLRLSDVSYYLSLSNGFTLHSIPNIAMPIPNVGICSD